MPDIIFEGDARDAAYDYFPPKTAGLEHFTVCRKDRTWTARNFAPGKPDGVMVGAPVVNANSAIWTPQSAFIETEVSQTADMTYFAIVKVTIEGIHHLISNFASPGTGSIPGNARGGALMFNTGSSPSDGVLSIAMDQSVGIAGEDASAPVTLLDSVLLNQWVCIAGRVTAATGQRKVFNLTAGTSAVATNTNPANLGSGKMRIGSSRVATTAFPIEMKVAGLFSTPLPDADLLEMHLLYKDLYAYDGVSL